jgi:hypothetical protein
MDTIVSILKEEKSRGKWRRATLDTFHRNFKADPQGGVLPEVCNYFVT